MRIFFALLGANLLLTGCVLPHPPPPPRPAAPGVSQSSGPVIKPDLQTAGQVAIVNAAARFVVISFSAGSTPRTGRQLYVFRNGLKVGELRITGPQRENDTVADIISGNIQLYDEVRAGAP